MNKKYKVLCLCGESASGKDTIKNKLLESTKDITHRIISCTTRPMREGEVNGKDYIFLTHQEAFDKLYNNEFLEMTDFRDWQYGTLISSLDINKINIGIFNPEGIEILEDQSDLINPLVVYLKADDKIRIKRSLNREEKPDIEEIFRRWQADKKDFENFPCHLELKNNNDSDMKRNLKILKQTVEAWNKENY